MKDRIDHKVFTVICINETSLDKQYAVVWNNSDNLANGIIGDPIKTRESAQDIVDWLNSVQQEEIDFYIYMSHLDDLDEDDKKRIG